MHPKFIDRPETLYVGMSAAFIPGSNNQEVIPPLWQEFTRRQPTIPNGTKPFIGLCTGIQADKSAVYTAAVGVSALGALPDGMVTLTTPSGKYAEFRHHGPIAGLGTTLGQIYGTWFPKSGFTRNAIAYDIEIYSSEHVDSATFELLYLVPLNHT